jgi:hypothetical protein
VLVFTNSALEVQFIGSLCLCVSSATLTEVFPCFSVSCKANARVNLAKTGHGQHSSKFVVCVVLLVICVVLFLIVLFCVLSFSE